MKPKLCASILTRVIQHNFLPPLKTVAYELPVQTGHDAPGSLDGEAAGAQQVQILASRLPDGKI